MWFEMERGIMLEVDFIEINFPYQISFTNFTLLKTF
jgi:hypothetical protein